MSSRAQNPIGRAAEEIEAEWDLNNGATEDQVPQIASVIEENLDKGRYFLDQDQDSHWFAIPVSRRPDWDRWKALDQDDPKGWADPVYATALPGHPNRMTFCIPKFS